MGKVCWNAGNEVWQFGVAEEEMRAALREVASQGYVEGYESIHLASGLMSAGASNSGKRD